MTYRAGCDCKSCGDQRAAIIDALEPRVLTAPPYRVVVMRPAPDERRPQPQRLLARRDDRLVGGR